VVASCEGSDAYQFCSKLAVEIAEEEVSWRILTPG
jgi:hypothetical protein